MDAIFNRKSTRKYTTQEVSDPQIEQLLRAAMSAPSARNSQPWEFVVTKNKDIFAKIMKIHPYSSMLKEASVAIIVCGNEEREIIKDSGYWVQDCSAAAENILIEATDMELGTVWLGVYPREDRISGLKKLFELPSHIIPLAIISIGYPAEEPPVKNKFNKDRIHFEKW